jgi:hypothetical protein
MSGLAPHGSPEDRGGADAYYHRPFNPHSKVNGVESKLKTNSRNWRDYKRGFENQDDRKDWS